MQHRRVQPKSGPAKKRPRLGVLVVFGSVACFGLLLLIVGLSKSTQTIPRPRETAKRTDDIQQRAVPPSKTAVKKTNDAESQSSLIDDDGKTLWVSPTHGPPIDLSYLPPGLTFIIGLRPESIAEHGEGDKLFDPNWPASKLFMEYVGNDLPAVHGVEQEVIGISVDANANWSMTQVVRISGGGTAADYVTSQFPNAEKKNHNGQNYWLHHQRVYYTPSADGSTLVVTIPEAIGDILDLAGEAPPLRRDMERLLAHTDADRDLTIVFAPNSLFSEARSIFAGEIARLREPLFWFLGDELSAAALSFDWDTDFFVELIATPTLDTPPERAARILAERVAEIPDKVEAYVVGLQPHAYGRMVVARFPAMVRKLSSYTRSGTESDHVVLNAYLPVVAGHNLLMGVELTLAEASRGSNMVAEATSPSREDPGEVRSVVEKLRQRTSLRFGRDTLDAALRQLSRDVKIPIVIRGSDLQADGITKNQSFGIDLADKPAEEVLVEILRLANPDKTAAGPSDVKQKLVYVIEKGDNGEQIVVTTRQAAATRGDQLPDVFRAAKP